MKRAGYSLFEVLIAFVVMTLVLAAILPGQAAMVSRLGENNMRLEAVDIALSHMATVGSFVPVSNGEMLEQHNGFVVSTKIAQGQLDGVTRNLVRVDVRVETLGGRALVELFEYRVAN